MEPIADMSWMKHLFTGKVVERFRLGDFHATAIRIPESEKQSWNQYHIRILFFQGKGAKPVFALNLETSILGSLCLTEQHGQEHLNLGHAKEGMTYKEFKEWALSCAEQDLSDAEAQA